MRRDAAWALTALVTWGAPASAEPASAPKAAALSWVRLPGAERCPDVRALAAQVEARLQRPAFVPPSEAQLLIEASAEATPENAWKVRIALSDDLGAALGTRELFIAEPTRTDYASYSTPADANHEQENTMKRNRLGYVLGALLAPGVAVMGCNGSVGIGSDSAGGQSGASPGGSAGQPVDQAGTGQVFETAGMPPGGSNGEAGAPYGVGGALPYQGGAGAPYGAGGALPYQGGAGAPYGVGGVLPYQGGAGAPYGIAGAPYGVAGAGNAGGSLSPLCSVPAGQVQTPTTTQTVYDALVGRWLICWGGVSTFDGTPSEIIGIEFSAPTTSGTILRGNAYYLVNDSAGAVVRGAGFDYQLTYDVSPQDPAQGSPVQLNLHPTPNTTSATQFRYSASPRQWQLTADSAHFNTKALLVVAD